MALHKSGIYRIGTGQDFGEYISPSQEETNLLEEMVQYLKNIEESSTSQVQRLSQLEQWVINQGAGLRIVNVFINNSMPPNIVITVSNADMIVIEENGNYILEQGMVETPGTLFPFSEIFSVDDTITNIDVKNAITSIKSDFFVIPLTIISIVENDIHEVRVVLSDGDYMNVHNDGTYQLLNPQNVVIKSGNLLPLAVIPAQVIDENISASDVHNAIIIALHPNFFFVPPLVSIVDVKITAQELPLVANVIFSNGFYMLVEEDGTWQLFDAQDEFENSEGNLLPVQAQVIYEGITDSNILNAVLVVNSNFF